VSEQQATHSAPARRSRPAPASVPITWPTSVPGRTP